MLLRGMPAVRRLHGLVCSSCFQRFQRFEGSFRSNFEMLCLL